MPPIYSLIAVAAPIVIYVFVVRPRLKARFTDIYADIDSFWARWWARAVAFRTLVIGGAGLMLPEIITALATMASSDLSFMPADWQTYIRTAALIGTIFVRARATAPGEEPPAA